MSDVTELIDRAIADDPPATLRDGGFIRDGYNEIVDHCNLLLRNGKEYIKDIENREKERTGIKNLKVKSYCQNKNRLKRILERLRAIPRHTAISEIKPLFYII
jgi:DNA mismatch repair ATPase MutS